MKEKNVKVDGETHRSLRIMAAKRDTSVKNVIKELVDKAKEQEKTNE